MLTKEPSLASLLVKQSPGMHYGHGWIAGQNGKRWHPSNSQVELLAGVTTKPKWKKKWSVEILKSFTNFIIKARTILSANMMWRFVIRHYRAMGVFISRLIMVPFLGPRK